MSGDEKRDLADRLRLAREQAGLSQTQVARMLGLHRPTVSEIEAGRRRVSADELRQFARIYRVDLDWLAHSGAVADAGYGDRVELAARELAKLKPQDLDRVLNLLSSMQREKSRK